MKRRGIAWLTLAATSVWLAASASAAVEASNSQSQFQSQFPPVPLGQSVVTGMHGRLSPVEYFRGLLGMSPAERTRALARRRPSDRDAIAAKLQEYDALPRDVREARLCQTELHWELFELIKLPPTGRSNRLVEVSILYRPMIDGLLRQWNEVPPETQKALLENQNFIGLYLRLQGSTPAAQHAILDHMPAPRRVRWEAEMAHWQTLPSSQRAVLCEQFQRFCSLSGPEQKATVNALSAEERKEMDEALQTFNQMPEAQRAMCINSFRKFATMDTTERGQFLQNAARWDAMTAHEREVWREVVHTLPPMPPMPMMPSGLPPQLPGDAPPMPPMPPNVTAPVVVTRNAIEGH